jgi:hypothetical protein
VNGFLQQADPDKKSPGFLHLVRYGGTPQRSFGHRLCPKLPLFFTDLSPQTLVLKKVIYFSRLGRDLDARISHSVLTGPAYTPY